MYMIKNFSQKCSKRKKKLSEKLFPAATQT